MEGLEGTSIGRVGRDVNRIRTSLLEGLGWKGIKGWKGRRLEGLDPDAVAGKGSRWEGLEGTLIGRVGSGCCC